MARRQHDGLVLLPVVLVCAGVVVTEFAHIDSAELDRSGMVRESVHDGVRCDAVRERFDPVAGPGLGRDHGG